MRLLHVMRSRPIRSGGESQGSLPSGGHVAGRQFDVFASGVSGPLLSQRARHPVEAAETGRDVVV